MELVSAISLLVAVDVSLVIQLCACMGLHKLSLDWGSGDLSDPQWHQLYAASDHGCFKRTCCSLYRFVREHPPLYTPWFGKQRHMGDEVCKRDSALSGCNPVPLAIKSLCTDYSYTHCPTVFEKVRQHLVQAPFAWNHIVH